MLKRNITGFHLFMEIRTKREFCVFQLFSLSSQRQYMSSKYFQQVLWLLWNTMFFSPQKSLVSLKRKMRRHFLFQSDGQIVELFKTWSNKSKKQLKAKCLILTFGCWVHYVVFMSPSDRWESCSQAHQSAADCLSLRNKWTEAEAEDRMFGVRT